MKAPVSPQEMFARNLIQLRKRQGLTQTKLAEDTGLTRQTIIKYEGGEVNPSISTVRKFSNALNVPFTYFFKENSDYEQFMQSFQILDYSSALHKIYYREGTSLDDETASLVKEESYRKLQKVLEIENLVGDSPKFRNPIKHLKKISTPEKAEEAALEVRKKWGLNNAPIANVISVLEREGIKVIEVSTSTNFEGLSARYGDIPIIVVNIAVDETTRRRFTALHELGHLILQIPETISSKMIERICDAFAAMMLFPKELLILELGNHRTALNQEELNVIKMKYGISVKAILVSAAHFEVISWDARKKLSNDPEISGTCNYSVPERPLRFKQLVFRSYAEKKIDSKKMEELFEYELPDPNLKAML